jgi:hypothetical protein
MGYQQELEKDTKIREDDKEGSCIPSSSDGGSGVDDSGVSGVSGCVGGSGGGNISAMPVGPSIGKLLLLGRYRAAIDLIILGTSEAIEGTGKQ